MNDKLKYIFSIDTKTTNRIIIYILGIRIRFLKKGMNELSKEYQNLDCPVTEIPKATGILRKAQLANLKMLEIFDNICKENSIEYWIDFGNLLGAVRHKGFIPWDDDIDVSMCRNDYEKFYKLFKNGIDNFNDLYLEFNNNGKDKCFLKVLHKKLPNIAIDIFPYDFYYKKTDDNEKIELSKLIDKIINRQIYKFLYPFFIKNTNGMRKRFFKITHNEILENQSVDISSKPSLFYGIDYPHRHKNKVFDYEDIFPLKTISYEDKNFPCPYNPEKVLSVLFGNYMELPNNCYPRHIGTGENKEFEKLLDKFITE